jgi:hypothetical protein
MIFLGLPKLDQKSLIVLFFGVPKLLPHSFGHRSLPLDEILVPHPAPTPTYMKFPPKSIAQQIPVVHLFTSGIVEYLTNTHNPVQQKQNMKYKGEITSIHSQFPIAEYPRISTKRQHAGHDGGGWG